MTNPGDTITRRPPAESNTADSVQRLVRLMVANHAPEELALGYLRYELVRRMSPHSFGELHKLNLSGKFLDDLVDEALKESKQPNGKISEVAGQMKL